MILEPFGPLIYQGEISEDFLSYLRAASATSHEDVGKLLAGHLRDQRLANANPKSFLISSTHMLKNTFKKMLKDKRNIYSITTHQV